MNMSSSYFIIVYSIYIYIVMYNTLVKDANLLLTTLTFCDSLVDEYYKYCVSLSQWYWYHNNTNDDNNHKTNKFITRNY